MMTDFALGYLSIAAVVFLIALCVPVRQRGVRWGDRIQGAALCGAWWPAMLVMLLTER